MINRRIEASTDWKWERLTPARTVESSVATNSVTEEATR